MKDFAQKSYWDERYKEEEQYEWLIKTDKVKEILKKYATKNSKILILGCGNSNLSYELYLDGYKDIVSTDYSETIIDKMKCKYNDITELKWECRDMFNLSYDADTFDIIFEKGTVDAVLANENQWSYAKTHKLQFDHFMRNIHKILKSNGLFLSISFHQPMFRIPLYVDFNHVENTPKWIVDIDEVEFGFHFLVYKLQKTESTHPSIYQIIAKYSRFQQNQIKKFPPKESIEEIHDFLSSGFDF